MADHSQFRLIIDSLYYTGPPSTVCNMSDNRSRGPEFDPGPVPYFHGDWSWYISMAILLPSADSRRVVVSYKQKYVHEVLVNRLVKLAQEKSVVRWLTILTWP